MAATDLPLTLLAWAGFLSVAGARVIDPMLTVIAGDFHVGIPEVGVIIAAFTLTYGGAQLVVGPLGDRFGKLRMILAALLAYAAMNVGCAMAASLPQLVALRMFAGASSAGLVPLCLAVIADNSPYAVRQVALSRFLVGVAMAQVLAGPLGGAFGEFVSWRGVFLLLAATAFGVAMMLALRLQRMPPLPHLPAAVMAAPGARRAYAALLRRGPVLLLLATLVDGAVFGGALPFLAPFLHQAFGLPFFAVGVVVACFGVGILVYRAAVGRMLPLLGERGSMLAGAVIAAGALLVGVNSDTWIVFIPVEVLLGMSYFTVHCVLQARATEMLPGASGTATSAFAFVLFMGQAGGVLLAGVGIDRLGYRMMFRLDAAVVLALGVFLWLLVQGPADPPAGQAAATPVANSRRQSANTAAKPGASPP